MILYHLAAAITNCQISNDSTCTNLPAIQASPENLRNILQLVFGIISIVTVIFIIISAIRYQVSIGNPEATAKLRNTIIFAAVGLAIALSAEIIVTVTLNKV